MAQKILTDTQTSAPRRRVLDTATRLFYANGIHGVGIDRIIAEAGVAKATFYNHFPSKEELVRAYIEEQDELGRAAVKQLSARPPREMILAILARISEAASMENYRGCPFLNAAAEYSDATSPVRRAIDTRRRWYHALLSGLAAAAGVSHPSISASLLVALSDGLLESAYLDDPKNIAALIHEGVTRILGEPAKPALSTGNQKR